MQQQQQQHSLPPSTSTSSIAVVYGLRVPTDNDSSSSAPRRLLARYPMALAATTKASSPMAASIHQQCGRRARRVQCRAAAGGMAAAVAAASSASSAPVVEAARRSASASACTASVADMWRQLQGCDDWQGLVSPPSAPAAAVHPVLRAEVARYGELVDACYKAFDLDPASRRHLNCKYGRERMLAAVGMPGAGYDVTRYVYAAADVSVPAMVEREPPSTTGGGRGRWIGYVAVSTDEMSRRLGRRDVLVSLRGTVTPAEWMANLMSSLEPARLDPCDPRPDVKVESGFLSLYTSVDKTCRLGGAGSCREQLLREVSRLVKDHRRSGEGVEEEVSVTLAGHSMGSALALLFAYDISELGLNRGAPVTVFSFGGPRVGNAAFKARCDELGVKALRVANVRDPITKLPGIFLNEATTAGVQALRPWRASCYTHVGVELPLDFFTMGDPASVHDLGTYVSLLKTGGDRQPAAARDDGVLAKVVEFLGRQRAGALAWQDAALQMGGLVQTLGLI